MTFKEMLQQPVKKMRYQQPELLLKLIQGYQKAEKDLYNRRPTNKEDLVTLMCMIGMDKFTKKTQSMIDQLNNI